MTDCPRCEHARLHGWCGPPSGLSHCHKCHRDWSGTTQAHCVGCCAHFSTYGIADLHLTPTGCRPPESVRTKAGEPLLRLDHDKHGPIWRGAERWVTTPPWREVA